MELKLIVIDVDGTMTDAGVYYDERGRMQRGSLLHIVLELKSWFSQGENALQPLEG